MSELAPEPVAPEAPEAETPEAPAESAWAGPSPEEWQETQEALQYLASLAQPTNPFQNGQQQGPEPVELDPLADDFREQLDRYIEQKNAPYQEYLESQRMREGDARAKDIIADEVAQNGEFVHESSQDRVRALANSYNFALLQQTPSDPRGAAEAAFELAIKDVREWEQAVGKAYHERQLNELGNLSGARRELGAGVNGQQFSMPTGGTLVDVAYRHGGGR